MTRATLELRCPRCHGSLESSPTEMGCQACSASFPVIAGIPDLRVCRDPYISLAEDRQKALHLAQKAGASSFAELVDYYYSITPEVPEDLAALYTERHLAGLDRARGIVERMVRYYPEMALDDSVRMLDLGCGTGGLVSHLARSGVPATGVDVALRWLVVARLRLRELGIGEVNLICACADHLPFADSSFDLVVAEGVLEHVENAEGVLAEVARVAQGGRLAARTVNRWVPAPEPHVQVWGVGFLPRAWMDGFVRWRRDLPYEHIHLRSWFEWRRIVRRRAKGELSVRLPEFTTVDLEQLPVERRRLLHGYQRLGRWAILRPLLTLFGPFLDIVGTLGRDARES